MPKETVRRKITYLKKKKLINHTTKLGLLPHEKLEDLMKPFASKEISSLSKFLHQLKKHKTLFLGPISSPIERKLGKYRGQILLLNKNVQQ